MARFPLRVVLSGLPCALLLTVGLVAWTLVTASSEAQQGAMWNCPQASRWAIAVWSGDDGATVDEALATCGNDGVSAAYYLDPQTGNWLRWFSGRPEISNLATLNNLQGIIALGSPSASPAATPAPPGGQDSIQGCPSAGRWAISVWSGQDGVGVDQALASCGARAVSAAYYLDPQTGAWLRWFSGRPEISNLATLNNLQGIVALGSAGFTLAVDKFGEGTITSSPSGISCGSDCTNQAATYPSGTAVVLTPTADPGSTFSAWSGCDSVSGDSCTVQIDRDKTVFATFAFSEVKIPETTKVLDAATMGYFIRQDGSTYYFDSQATAVAALQPGDVIVSGVGEGFIRKVTAVNATAEEIAVETADATLEDAIEQGTVILHQRLTPADVQSAQVLAPGASTSADMTAASLLDFTVPIDRELLPGLKLYGSLSFNADLDIAISFDGWDWGCLCFPVKEVRAILTTQNVTELGLSADVTVSGLRLGAELAPPLPLPPIWVMVGAVPVGFFPEISIGGDIEGRVGAGTETSISVENTLVVGGRYHRDGGWESVLSYSPVFSYADPTLSPEVSEVTASVGPALSVKVYGLVGPYFGVGGFLKQVSNPVDTPQWRLYGGISASAGFEVGALGLSIGPPSWSPLEIQRLLGEGNIEPTPAPAPSGRIAFDSDRDGNFEIYVMNADGTGVTRLTNGPAADGGPAWSPDGTRIAFTHNFDDIYVMNADGTNQTNLTNSAALEAGPAWSPDGSRIAFQACEGLDYGPCDIYVMSADGAGRTNLTGTGDNSACAWSPDGSKIVFSSHRDGNIEIYLMNPDGTGVTRLTHSVGSDWLPAWSPDGTKIAFTSDREDPGCTFICNEEIYVMNADGGGQTRVTSNPASDLGPDWSPDGSKIAFESYRDGNYEVYVMNADGTGQTNLTNNPASDHRPAWSP